MTRLPPLDLITADLVAACDYQRHALQRLDANALAYLQGGAADELTCQVNLNVWQDWALLPRLLRDLRVVDLGLQHPLPFQLGVPVLPLRA